MWVNRTTTGGLFFNKTNPLDKKGTKIKVTRKGTLIIIITIVGKIVKANFLHVPTNYLIVNDLTDLTAGLHLTRCQGFLAGLDLFDDALNE